MKTSNEINELAAALAKAQGEFSNPPRNRGVKVSLKTGGSYTFHYTTLDCIIDMIRPAMAKNGLSFSQSVTLDEDWVIVTTRILHSSGQWIEDVLPVKPEGFGPQQVGSALTYGKRYSLAALLGIASDEDDDGNLGSGHTSEEIKASPPPKRGTKSKAAEVAEQHGMTTADKLPAKATVTFEAAFAKVSGITDLAKIESAVEWTEAERIAQRFTKEQYEQFSLALAERSIEICEAEADYERADKIIRGMVAKMRLTDPVGTDLRVKLADAKDSKLGAAA